MTRDEASEPDICHSFQWCIWSDHKNNDVQRGCRRYHRHHGIQQINHMLEIQCERNVEHNKWSFYHQSV